MVLPGPNTLRPVVASQQTAMNRAPTTCIVLVEKDEGVFSRIDNLLNATCSIVWYPHLEEAIVGLREPSKVDLIIINETHGVVGSLKILRDQIAAGYVPALVLCEVLTEELVKRALQAGASDLLALSDPAFDKKVRFFSRLVADTVAQPNDSAYANVRGFVLPRWKRTLDVVVSLTASVLLSPLLLLVAALIKLDSKGPVLYKSKRVGANFRVFEMYKFRTMTTQADRLLNQIASRNIYAGEGTSSTPALKPATAVPHLCDACRQTGASCQRTLFDQNQYVCEQQYLLNYEAGATFLKFRNDPRITRLGRFLRNSSIDELPQLFNILIGDMSLVGNRPLPVYEAEKLTVDHSVKRFTGPSGLTGLWQVEKRAKGQVKMDEQERISLDIEYAETFSFRKDMAIIYRTIFSLWQKENV